MASINTKLVEKYPCSVVWKIKPLVPHDHFAISPTTPKLNRNKLPTFEVNSHWIPNLPLSYKDYCRNWDDNPERIASGMNSNEAWMALGENLPLRKRNRTL